MAIRFPPSGNDERENQIEINQTNANSINQGRPEANLDRIVVADLQHLLAPFATSTFPNDDHDQNEQHRHL